MAGASGQFPNLECERNLSCVEGWAFSQPKRESYSESIEPHKTLALLYEYVAFRRRDAWSPRSGCGAGQTPMQTHGQGFSAGRWERRDPSAHSAAAGPARPAPRAPEAAAAG